VFEVDQPGPQEWKRQRLAELGYQVPDWLHLIPFDFEDGDWHRQLAAAGFDPGRPAVVASTGVSMYLTREANLATLRQLAGFAPGSTLVMSFLLPAALLAEEDREGLAVSQRGAAASGTPFRSLFAPREVMALAREAGFADVRHVCAADQNARYFAGRADGLRSPTGEDLLIATTGSPAGPSYALAAPDAAPPNACAAAWLISASETSRRCWDTPQRWPKGSVSWPSRSPQNVSASGRRTCAPPPSARAQVASTSSTCR